MVITYRCRRYMRPIAPRSCLPGRRSSLVPQPKVSRQHVLQGPPSPRRLGLAAKRAHKLLEKSGKGGKFIIFRRNLFHPN